MPQNSKMVILIPAYNEERNIGRAIELIRETKVDAEIIVINDGSTDQTSQIAKSKGCTVIDMPKNFGKANAFFAGVREALKRNPECVMTMDADVTKIPSNVFKVINEKIVGATRKREIKMAVVRQYEGFIDDVWGPEYLTGISGFRAFSIPALHKILRTKIKSSIKGYGLEMFLLKFFKYKTELLGDLYVFHTGPTRMGITAHEQVGHMLRKISKRVKKIRPR